MSFFLAQALGRLARSTQSLIDRSFSMEPVAITFADGCVFFVSAGYLIRSREGTYGHRHHHI